MITPAQRETLERAADILETIDDSDMSWRFGDCGFFARALREMAKEEGEGE